MVFRTALLTVIVSFFASASAFSGVRFPEKIVGHWLYYKKIYRGVEMPEPPEATLRLHFEFFSDGTDRLYWWHEGEGDLCERRGAWTMAGNTLHDRVTWVNPQNSVGCGRDPDMQVGRETASPVSFSENGDFLLYLVLGDDPLVYVWKKISDNGR